ncbi:kelch-like ECH-associated protein 1 isoform X2 [Hyalella azteca]|uniref:Kelch-like protein diablo n=1 Tax=Hyalella azteca TaxID=294128 RepID=A0A8B7N7M3_HYAAZ|nr:kelch-like ECH-associated protein 1 isoform X2 [Hyalella azteca]
MEEELAVLVPNSGSHRSKLNSLSESSDWSKNVTEVHHDKVPHCEIEYNFSDFRVDSFKAMFTSGMQESATGVVPLHGVSFDTMAHLVRFMYSGLVIVNEQIVCQLLPAASMFQIRQVVQACSKFLEEQMEANNVIGISNFAERNGCSELYDKTIAFVEENFSEVSQCEEFLELSSSQLIGLIKKDTLNVPDEQAVYSAVVRWVEHSPKVRAEKMQYVLKFIRCHYLPPHFISEQMSQCTIVKSVPACREYLENVFKELSMHKPPSEEARRAPSTACLVHLVGGYDDRRSQASLHCYHVQKNTWTELGPMPVARSGLGAVFLRGSLYVVGGRTIHPMHPVRDLSSLSLYNYADRSWRECKSLQQKRNRMGVCVLDTFLYAVGGVDDTGMLDSVERYQPEDDTWHSVSSMKEARGALCCVSLNRHMYAIGGCDGTSRLASVERYDPDTNTWTSVASLLQARSGAGAVVVSNKIYVVGGYDGSRQISSVECYDPETDSWTSLASMLECRSALAVAASLTTIYAMGGFDGSQVLSSTEVYDVLEDKWSASSPMPWGRSGHALAVPSCLAVSPRFIKKTLV